MIFYVVVAAVLFELISYIVVVQIFDNGLGNRAERHLYSSIRGHQLNPDYRRREDTENRLIHSEQGFRRDSPVSVEKPENVFRIIVLGGSTLYGIGTSSGPFYPAHRSLFNDETITHYLEEMLNKAFSGDPNAPQIEVINAGVTAYHTFQHVLYIYETLYEYNPDVILFVDGHNDFYNVGVKNPITEYGYSSYNLVRALNERRPFFSAYLGTRSLARYSYFFKLLEKMTQMMSSTFEARPYNISGDKTALQKNITQEISDTAKVGFLRNYKLIQSLADYHDFTLHVFLQPEVVFEDMTQLSKHDQAIAKATRERYGEQRELIMIETRKLLADLFSASEIPFTDIGEIAHLSEGDAALYMDYTHLTPRGSYLVAEQMLPVVEDMIRQRLAERSTLPANAATLSSDDMQ